METRAEIERTIQWYPGHMAKAMRRITEDMAGIDVVIECADARVPFSGTNPALANMAGRKPHLLVLTREQLADAKTTQAWLHYYAASGRIVCAVDAKDRRGVSRLRAALAALPTTKTTMRAIVLGIPNAGKSTVINALVGRNVARAEDRAGVTRSRQWFRVERRFEIMDTAGILVPKIDTADAQWKLALIGAVPRARFDAEDVVTRLARWARSRGADEIPDLLAFAEARGFVARGTVPDTHNAGWAYIKDWSDGKFGRMTLEEPSLAEASLAERP